MSSAYSSLILASSPLLYYKLDAASGNFSDSGSAALTANPAGTGLVYQQSDVWGGSEAVSLSATNYIEVPDAAALDTLTTALTVECLVRWSDGQSSTMMVNRWSGLGGTLCWYLSTSPSYGGRAAFTCYLNSAQKGVNDTRTTLINDGKWHHLAGVYDGSYVRLYVDGFDVGNQVAATGSLPTASLPVRMGMLSDTTGWNFSGGLSHVAIYPVALSAATIVSHSIESIGMSMRVRPIRSFAALHNRYFL